MLDEADKNLIRNLVDQPELPVAQLAERAGMTSATAARRIEKLARQGVLKGQHAIIDWRALGYAVEVSLRFSLEKANPRAFDEFLVEARKIPEVIEIQSFLGRVDTRLSVIARDMAHYQEIYRSRILNLPHISDIEALMHISAVKSARGLPI